MINAAALQWNISADRLETFASEQLTSSPDILDVGEAIVVLVRAFSEGSTGDAESSVFSHPRYQKFEMVLPKRHIGVQVPNDFEIQALHLVIPSVEGMSLSGEVALASFWHPDQIDPGALRHVLANDFVGAIGGTVTNNHPFERRNGLSHHRLERQLDKFRFVARGSDKDVSWECWHG